MSTAMEAALRRAGFDPRADLTAVAAQKALATHDNDPRRALNDFLRRVDHDDWLLRFLAAAYLEGRAADMRGDHLPGGGHSTAVPHRRGAPSRQPQEDDAGQKMDGSTKLEVPASSSPNADRAGQGGSAQAASESLPARSAPDAEGGGQTRRAPAAIAAVPPPSAPLANDRASMSAAKPTARSPVSLAPPVDGGRHFTHAPRAIAPVRSPSPPRGLAAIASIQPALARSVPDTFIVRDGRAIGDLCWHELIKIARGNEREARVLRLVEQHVANADPFARVRSIVSARTVEDAIKLAEAANAD